MTIVTQPYRASALATAGRTNNPFFLFDNLITAYTAPDGAQSGGPVANLSSPATAKYVFPTANADGTYRIQFTASGGLSCVGLASHNLATVGATVQIQYQSGSSWIDSGAGTVTPSDNQAIVWRFAERTATNWRVLISGSPSSQPIFAILQAGIELIIEQRVYTGYAPPIRPNRVAIETNVTEGGHYTGAAVSRTGSTTSVSFTHIEPTFIRGDTFKSFITHFNSARPFFWAWRPTQYDEVFYSWREGNSLQPQNSGPQRFMSFGLSMRLHDEP